MPFFDPIRIGAAGAADTGFTVDRSLRCSGADQTRLNYTPASGGEKKRFTFSFWIKRGNLDRRMIFGAYNSGASTAVIEIQDDGLLHFYDYVSGYRTSLRPAQVFRDPTAWYHIVVIYNSTLSTSSDRAKIYVNGSRVTEFDTATYPSLNQESLINDHTIQHAIGTEGALQRLHFDGYMAEFYFLDGIEYDASYFGETDATTGQWIPKEYEGSFGNNGYYLKFADNSSTSALGTDSSGNGNNLTPVNFSVSAGSGNDSLEDTPTNNFSTFNPLFAYSTNFATFSNGNLDHSLAVSQIAASSFLIPKTGKWYAEYVLTAGALLSYLGVRNPALIESNYSNGISMMQFTDDGSTLSAAAQVRVDNSYVESLSSSYANNDILGIKVDRDGGTIQFTKNGSNISTAINLSGASDTSDLVFVIARSQSGSYSFAGSVNFGQRSFSYLPTGYQALCSQNIPDPTILDPTKHFDTLLWTGDGNDNRNITGLNFQPDWVWIKERSNTSSHVLTDSVRGIPAVLESNITGAEDTSSGAADIVQSFNSDGFQVGTSGRANQSGQTNVGWNWNAGDTDGKTYAVTVVSDSGNKYRFDGYGTSAVTLDLAEGGTYIFDQSDSSNAGHPLRFYTAADKTGGEYTTGVTTAGTPGSSGAYTQIVVAASAPTLYYQCSVHAGMGGQANTNSTLGSSNFDGTIQTTVKANQSAGFSIVLYEGQGDSDITLGHGLNAVPNVVLVKERSGSRAWIMYHSSLGANKYLQLASTQVALTNNDLFGNTTPTSSVFTVSDYGTSDPGDDYVAYCFSEVEGYSKFGSYTGNGSTDGTFVFTGFRPAFLIFKRSSNSASWRIFDNKRDTDNVLISRLLADSSGAENTSRTVVDFLSNGFKLRANNAGNNNSGDTYIYLAFAESPFKNARAR